jgi:hypothetical protein
MKPFAPNSGPNESIDWGGAASTIASCSGVGGSAPRPTSIAGRPSGRQSVDSAWTSRVAAFGRSIATLECAS